MSFDTYQIAIMMSLTNNVSVGLRDIAKESDAADEALKKTEKRLKSIEAIGKAGAVLSGVGGGILASFRGPLEEAKKFQTEAARFAAMGFGDQTNSQAEKFAKSMNLVGQSAGDGMKILREATAITGDFQKAQAIAPTLARMKFGMDSVMSDGDGSKFEDMFQAALQTTELRGALVDGKTGQFDAEKFNAALDKMTQAYVASGGMVKPQDFAEAMKSGGLSTKMMSDDMFYFGLGHFMQKSGGSEAGAASASLFQNIAMGDVSKRTADALVQAHLLDEKNMQYDKQHKFVGIKQNGIEGADTFTQNPFKWINEVVVPQLQKQGFSGDKLDLQLASVLGLKPTANLSHQFVQDQKLAQGYMANAGKAAGVDKLAKIGAGTDAGQMIELQKRWGDLMQALGEQVMPSVISALEFVNPLLKGFTEWMREHGTIVKVVAFAFIGLGAALAGLGILATVAAGFNSLVMVLRTLGGAETVAAFGFKSIGGPGGIKNIGASLVGSASNLSKLGAAADLASAFFVGWELGSWLYDTYIQGTKFSDWLGSLIARVLAFFGNKDAQEALDANRAAEQKKTTQAGAQAQKIRDAAKVAQADDKRQLPPQPATGAAAAAGTAASASDPKKNVAMPPAPRASRSEAASADSGSAVPTVNVDVHAYLEGKDILSYFVKTTSFGTTGMNTSAALLSPATSSYGIK